MVQAVEKALLGFLLKHVVFFCIAVLSDIVGVDIRMAELADLLKYSNEPDVFSLGSSQATVPPRCNQAYQQSASTLTIP